MRAIRRLMDSGLDAGIALDSAFIERLWRSLKYEPIYPGDFTKRGLCVWRLQGRVLSALTLPSTSA